MSRNRVDYVIDAIESVRRQTYRPMRVIISDNSSSEKVPDLLHKTFPDLEIRRRRPNGTAYEHLNWIFNEASAPYFLVFHDDDLMSEDCVASLASAMERDPSLACACPNAKLIYGKKASRELFNPAIKNDLVLKDPLEVARRYIDYSRGINPFPGYLYRRSMIQGLRFDVNEAEQYSDLTFITKVAGRGQILWLAKPLIQYRKHGANHSATISLLSAKKALRHLESEGILEAKSKEARLFRYWNHFFFLKNHSGRNARFRWRQFRLVFLYFAFHPQPILRRVLQKLCFH